MAKITQIRLGENKTEIVIDQEISRGDFLDINDLNNIKIDINAIENYLKNLKDKSFSTELDKELNYKLNELKTPLQNEIKELKTRIDSLQKEKELEIKSKISETENKVNENFNAKFNELNSLISSYKAKLEEAENNKKSEIKAVSAEMDKKHNEEKNKLNSEIAKLANSLEIKDKEFNTAKLEVESKIKDVLNKEILNLKNNITELQAKIKNEEENKNIEIKNKILEKENDIKQSFTNDILNLKTEVSKYQAQIEALNSAKKTEIENIKFEMASSYNSKINELNNQLNIEKNSKESIKSTTEAEVKLKINQEYHEKISNLEKEINNLKNDKTILNSEKTIEISKLENQHKGAINTKDEEIEKLKKQLDEATNKYKWTKYQNWDRFSDGGLENDLFERWENNLQRFYENATFIKDNITLDDDGVRTADGTKGDFIYREKNEEGLDISISFECKNEKRNTTSNKRIENHYTQANMNRNKKNCKYAVIVTTLDPDKNFTIKKVKDFSDMYVIRPEYFEEIIYNLRENEYNVFKETLRWRKENEGLRQANVDYDKFENKIIRIKDSFNKHFAHAQSKFNATTIDIDKAIEELRRTIKKLEETKNDLVSTDKYLGEANDDLSDLTIKKLTHGLPEMRKKFNVANEEKAKIDSQNDE